MHLNATRLATLDPTEIVFPLFHLQMHTHGMQVQVCHALPNFILQLNNSATHSKPVVLRHDKSRKLIKLNA